jgi:molybdopterin/thiamine biosynthesis adenylyltransferase
MKNLLNKRSIERFSRQIILKNIGIIGQKKILSSKVLIVGVGGLGSSVAEFLSRAGVGHLGIVDNDKVSLSNLHRQSLYNASDINKFKVHIIKNKIKKINYDTKIKAFNLRLNNLNFKKIINKYDYIVDGSDNFKTKFLLNDFCLKYKKNLITGAISKFDGHVFAFDFKNKRNPCLRCFFQEIEISDDLLNCESEGILGTVAGIIGTIQANEILKRILNIGKSLDGYILILDLLNLNFRKVKIKKRKKCFCNQ